MLLVSVAVVLATATAPDTAAHAAVAHRADAARAHHDSQLRRVDAPTEGKVIKLVNKKRTSHGCNALHLNKALRRAARRHSNKMGAALSLSHQLPGEPALGRRVSNAGYRGWTRIGENIAYGYPTPRSVVNGWMHSPPHRRNILDCRYKDVGVGVAEAGGYLWWTADFGRK